MNMCMETFQDVKNFRDQSVAMKNVCDELGLWFGRCEEEVKAIIV